jgi:hypothetical protein
MKRTLITAGTVVFFAAAGYAGQGAEVDQIAQQQMIGLSKKKILACLGAPAKRVRIGATDIWTYPIGEAHFESPFLAPAFLLAPSASAGLDKRACDVNIILTNGAVSQVVYHGAGGGPLPLGRQCLFAVQNCTSPVAPFAVKAAY